MGYIILSFIDKQILINGANELGLDINDIQAELFDQFASLLVEANKTTNLTRISEPKDIVINHFLDSFTCLTALKIPDGSSFIDVGTGAGFPGIPLAILYQNVKFTLLDSTKKKLDFIENAASELKLNNIKVLHLRAEEAAKMPKYRAKFDFASARALSDLSILAELCIPLLKIGGVVIAQKSKDIDDEINQAKPIIGSMGAKIERIIEMKIPESDIIRKIVVLKKISATPSVFPRHFSKISKR